MAYESHAFSNFSTTQTFTVNNGGRFMVNMMGTSGTLSLKRIGPDGSTAIICKDVTGTAITNGSLGTASTALADLAPGQYNFSGSTPVGAYAEVIRCNPN